MKKEIFSVKKLIRRQKDLRKRILEICHKSHFSHIGSCFSAIDAIDAIYAIKKENDKLVLSNGHAGVALYAVLENYKKILDKNISESMHVHPDRNTNLDIHVSTGSLGQGLPIAVGMAIAEPLNKIYCIVSDGECTEGSIWEAIRVIVENKLNNLKIIVISNGWGAYDAIDTAYLKKRLSSFGLKIKTVDGHNSKKLISVLREKTTKVNLIFAKTTVEQLPFLHGQDAHYYIMKDKDFKLGIKILA